MWSVQQHTVMLLPWTYQLSALQPAVSPILAPVSTCLCQMATVSAPKVSMLAVARHCLHANICCPCTAHHVLPDMHQAGPKLTSSDGSSSRNSMRLARREQQPAEGPGETVGWVQQQEQQVLVALMPSLGAQPAVTSSRLQAARRMAAGGRCRHQRWVALQASCGKEFLWAGYRPPVQDQRAAFT